MAVKNPRKLFVNFVVRDLKASMDFYRKLGFEFNPQFTDERAACMTLNPDAQVMLLQENFFRSFTNRELVDTKRHIEQMTAFSCGSRQAVDKITEAAFKAGGTPAMPPLDMGFMYSWSFCDLDGHHWEPMWMDQTQAPTRPY